MRPTKSQLYDAMGELIYAVAKAKGIAAQNETSLLPELLAQYDWAKAVEWSFNYEDAKQKTMEEAYSKAIDTCKAYGPAEEYASLMQVLEILGQGKASAIAPAPSVLLRFQTDLTNHFMAMDFQ